MLHDSPLRKRHAAYQEKRPPPPDSHRPGAAQALRAALPEIEYVPYGPAELEAGPACELVATFGELESEYAAIRKGAGLLDSPHRGTIRVSGTDRRDFLNRLLTQELKDLEAGMARPSFWLNRAGRIQADLMLIELGDRLLVDVDIHGAGSTVETLSGFLFSEDVEIADVSARHHHLAVHGRRGLEVVAAATGAAFEIDDGGAATVRIAGTPVVVARRDLTGEVGLELSVPYEQVEAVWDALLGVDERIGESKRRIRPIGWHALNIARIEAGTPLFHIDFGPTNLPHETGVLHDRVSFTKGCYLGQEIVARVESLGRPKQMLVGLRMARDLLPVAEAQVFERDPAGGMGPQIGVVTSSTLSPMLGAAPVAFALIKIAHAEPGTTVLVNAEGDQTEATIAPLRFYPPPEEGR